MATADVRCLVPPVTVEQLPGQRAADEVAVGGGVAGLRPGARLVDAVNPWRVSCWPHLPRLGTADVSQERETGAKKKAPAVPKFVPFREDSIAVVMSDAPATIGRIVHYTPGNVTRTVCQWRAA